MSPHAQRLASLSGVTAEVQSFYERYPYPQPIDSLDRYRSGWQSESRRRADYHLFWPARAYRESRSILVAGCGTSQAAKHALRWPAAQVIGIDFSATSVRCTAELKRKYSLNNLELRQLPIERAGELGQSFDQIVCTGVLHHLPDPAAGLEALRDVLAPEGAMHLMVYAPYGRAGVYMLQEFCKRLGIGAADEDIRELVAALRVLPAGHPLETLLREAPDFRQEAALADALLHPQDRAYSVPQLLKFIRAGRLRFGRWLKQAPYLPHCGVIPRLPQFRRIVQLAPEEQYAALELFRGTMVRHSLVAYRDDSTGAPQQISFRSDDWLHYVPIRAPDAICVQERLRAGAAAVLINRTHSFRDLYLPLNATEKRLFDAIDGVASIGDILKRIATSAHRTMRTDATGAFFERLWWHDQVVIDASRCEST